MPRRLRSLAFGLIGAALALVGALTATAARAPASLWLDKVEYVDAALFGASFGLTYRETSAREFSLTSQWTTIKAEVGSRESEINGQRVFLGEAVRVNRGRPLFSRIDADALLTPVLRPGADQARIPRVKTIVLDPGHGGRDSGKVNPRVKVQEKTLALDTAQRVQRLLAKDGYRVVLTRSKDRFVELGDRPDLARRVRADLFISLHYNSVESGADRVTGVEVFTMTPQHQYSTSDSGRDDDASARQENAGNANDHWNALLGYRVHGAMIEALKVPDRGLKRARWAVLRLAPCPAILIESGYLSNDAEARRIADPAYRQRIAVAIATGIRAYARVLDGIGAPGQARRP
ncbi:N-acetylmuramoyl-L-alanine amidase [Horticoccus luteus]|uniref:N-acetylmuramoyl-L-alanine amidase n=1 Tax=Horticoccus luteus TaxID=2862869 RepID=A0A8F9XKV6_9BACT|nr:N-acetylmuramoyl-L-alanine amidase [Horticoccus luteus]QYM80078.1 N-acetylmuramoyl-L-alanine amidase [Horticoccus luteus]